MVVRRKSEAIEPPHPSIINRRPTPIEKISATATRRDVFAMKLAGFAAVALSAIEREDTFNDPDYALHLTYTARCNATDGACVR